MFSRPRWKHQISWNWWQMCCTIRISTGGIRTKLQESRLLMDWLNLRMTQIQFRADCLLLWFMVKNILDGGSRDRETVKMLQKLSDIKLLTTRLLKTNVDLLSNSLGDMGLAEQRSGDQIFLRSGKKAKYEVHLQSTQSRIEKWVGFGRISSSSGSNCNWHRTSRLIWPLGEIDWLYFEPCD